MRPVSLTGQPSLNASVAAQLAWLTQAVNKLAMASRQEGGSHVTDPYTVTEPSPPLRTLDASTATLGEVAGVLTTLITDMQKGGSNQPRS